MATLVGKYKIKRSNVPGEVPTSLDLDVAELAVNTADGRLFIKKDDNTIFEFAGLGATSLVDLVDVEAPSPGDGEVLAYNATSQVWQPLSIEPVEGGNVVIIASTSPLQRPNGGALTEGDMWVSDIDQSMYVWDGTDWELVATASGISAIIEDLTPTLGGTLQTNGFPITGLSGEDVTVFPSVGQSLVVRGNVSPGSIKFSGSNPDYYAGIKGPADSGEAAYFLTLPDSAGNAGQVLITDGTGALSWANNGEGLGLGLNDLIDVTYEDGELTPAGLETINFEASASTSASISTSGINAGLRFKHSDASGYIAELEASADFGLNALTRYRTFNVYDYGQNRGRMRFMGDYPNSTNARYIEFRTPAQTGGWTSQTYTLPTSIGAAGDILSTDESGNLSWIPLNIGSSFELNDISDVSYVSGNFEPFELRDITFYQSNSNHSTYISTNYGRLGMYAGNSSGTPTTAQVEVGEESVNLSTSSGYVYISNSSASVTNTPELRLSTGNPLETSNTGAYIGFKMPENFYLNKTYILPLTDGAPGDALVTDGDGVLGWANPSDGGIEGIGDLDDVNLTGVALSEILQYNGQQFVSRSLNDALAQPLSYVAEPEQGVALLGSTTMYESQVDLEADGFTHVLNSSGSHLTALPIPVPEAYQNTDYVGLNTTGLTNWYLNTAGAVYAHTQEALLVGTNSLATLNAAEVEMYVQVWGQDSGCRIAGYQEHTDIDGDQWFVVRADFSLPYTSLTAGFPVEWWFGLNGEVRVLYGEAQDNATYLTQTGSAALVSRGAELTEWGSSIPNNGNYTVPIVSQGSTVLRAIGDVSDVLPADGQALVWSEANQLWEPGAGGGGGGPGTITVQERAGSEGAPQNPATEITTLSFNTNNGFSVTDLGGGEALVNLGSAFAPWHVAGQDTLDPEGEEPIAFVAGDGIEITTVSTSDPKQIIFNSTGGGKDRIQDMDDYTPKAPAVDLGQSRGTWTEEWPTWVDGAPPYFIDQGNRWASYNDTNGVASYLFVTANSQGDAGDWSSVISNPQGHGIVVKVNGIVAGKAQLTNAQAQGNGRTRFDWNTADLDSNTFNEGGYSENTPIVTGGPYSNTLELWVNTWSSLNPEELPPADGDVLQWNALDQKFQPAQPSTGGGAGDSTISWSVTADGTSSYVFAGDGFAGNETNPALYVVRGQTYEITNSMGLHPLQIQSTAGIGGTPYSDGITNNSVADGTLTWEVRLDAPAELYYQCTAHADMGGTIQVLENSSGGGGGAVDSVNGQTGAVVLKIEDLDNVLDDYVPVTPGPVVGPWGLNVGGGFPENSSEWRIYAANTPDVLQVYKEDSNGDDNSALLLGITAGSTFNWSTDGINWTTVTATQDTEFSVGGGGNTVISLYISDADGTPISNLPLGNSTLYIQTDSIPATGGPSDGEVLTWNESSDQWVPAAPAAISLTDLKQVVADSTDFADFQTRIANL